MKYKITPPSTLFKNRLFVERDSKARRVVNNFGLVFRSSKWSTYSKRNVYNDFKFSYTKIFFFLLLLLIIIFFFLNIYETNSYFLNNLNSALWTLVDSFDYLLSFIVWSILNIAGNALSSFLTVAFKQEIMFKEFEIKKFNFKQYKHYGFKKQQKEQRYTIETTKAMLSKTLYTFMNPIDPKTTSINMETMLSVHETHINEKNWFTYYNFYPTLYKSSNYLALNFKSKTIFSSSIFKNSDLFYFNNNNFLETCLFSNFSKYFLSIIFTNNNNLNQNNQIFSSFQNKKLNFISKNNAFGDKNFWFTFDIFNQNNNFSWLKVNKIGSFFINKTSSFDLTPDAKFINIYKNILLNNSILNQNQTAKWDRWLYRYSLLHRKILKNSQKLTLTKTFINSGFSNSNFFNKNIWNVNYFKKNNLPALNFTFFSDFYFNTFFNVKQSLFFKKNQFDYINNNNINNLSLFNEYEKSYFWFLKRIYFFNTLSNNLNIVTKQKISNNFSTNFFLKFFLTNNLFNNQLFFFMAKNKIFFFNDFVLENNFKTLFIQNDKNFNSSDVNIFLNEFDLLSKDNLFFLNFLTLNSSSTNNNVISLFFKNNYPFANFFNYKLQNQKDLYFSLKKNFLFINDFNYNKDLFFFFNNK